MRVIKKVHADVDSLQFGYWDMETEKFVPINAERQGELMGAASALGCTEGLLDALAMFAANISEMVGDDLRSIWRRLDEAT